MGTLGLRRPTAVGIAEEWTSPGFKRLAQGNGQRVLTYQRTVCDTLGREEDERTSEEPPGPGAARVRRGV